MQVRILVTNICINKVYGVFVSIPPKAMVSDEKT